MTNQHGISGILARIPLNGISHRLAPWGLALHAALTLSGSIWSLQHEIANGGHATAYAVYQAVGFDLLRAFGVSTAIVVTLAEVIDTAMVIAHFVGKRMKAEGREEGLAEGREEGLAEGREEGLTEGIALGRAQAEAELNEKLHRCLEAHPELKDAIAPLLTRSDSPKPD